MSTTLKGTGTAGGVAVGPTFLVLPTPEAPSRSPGSAAAELELAREALDKAHRDLLDLASSTRREIGSTEAGIFEAQAAFASDPEVMRTVETSITDGVSAEKAIEAAYGSFLEVLAKSPSKHMAARAVDVEDVRDRVIAVIFGEAAAALPPPGEYVVVAEDLKPSQTAGLPRSQVMAIVTERGTATSHSSILARSLGVPAVTGVRGLLDALTAESVIAVDGQTGEVVVDPSPDLISQFQERATRIEARRTSLRTARTRPGQTADGHRVEIAANLGSLEDVAPALKAGAEGVGLVRTEFLFLGREEPPSVSEQTGMYREILGAFPGQRVVFRTLDAGSDKPLGFVPQDEEPNPALGMRGIRFSLRHPELFTDQLRALLRAGSTSQGKLAVMFPMVAVRSELNTAAEILTETAVEEGIDAGSFEVGAMIEVPSALLTAGELIQDFQFASLGTNDLLQYMFAVDRLLPDLADLPDLLDPGILRILQHGIGGVHQTGAWVGVCGETASSPIAAAALVGLGVDELSMAPSSIPPVKHLLGGLTLDELRGAVSNAMAAPDALAARDVLTSRWPGLSELGV